MDTELVVALTLTASVMSGPALQPSKPSVNQPVRYPGSVDTAMSTSLARPAAANSIGPAITQRIRGRKWWVII